MEVLFYIYYDFGVGFSKKQKTSVEDIDRIPGGNMPKFDRKAWALVKKRWPSFLLFVPWISTTGISIAEFSNKETTFLFFAG